MILNRYILKELAFPFLLTLGILVSILMMDQIYKFIPLLQATGLKFSFVLRMVLYTAPMTIMLATPISTMVGVYYGIQRFSQDSEIIAMRASGISLSYLFRPVLTLATILSLFVFLLSFYLTPMGVMSMKILEFEIVKQQAKLTFEPGRINNFFGESMIYYQSQEGDKLKGIIISDWSDPDESLFFEAEEGEIQFNEETKNINFHLTNGRVHFLVNQNEPKRLVSFEYLDYSLTPKSKNTSYKSKEMRFNVLSDVDRTLFQLLDGINTATNERMRINFVDEFHSRIVTTISCFAFALFAIPFGIFDPRNPKPAKFVYMLLFLVAFNAFFTQCRSLFLKEQLPIISYYLLLVIAVVIALVNFFKVNYDVNSIKELIKLPFIQNSKKK